MSDDPLLNRLGEIRREEQEAELAAFDERWDRLSAGELSPEEEAELRALAESSPEHREAYEAFRPLGPDFQARLVRTIQEQGSAAGPAPSQPAARVLPFRKLATRFGGSLAAVVAAAAVLVLLLRVPGSQPLPGYALELSGGIQEMRGAEPEPLRRFAPGSPFELIARPATAASGPVAVRCFLGRGDALRPWDVPTVVAGEGVVRIAGTVGREVVLPPGEWTLWVVVGRPGKLPDAAALREHLSRPPPEKPDWVVLRSPLRAG